MIRSCCSVTLYVSGLRGIIRSCSKSSQIINESLPIFLDSAVSASLPSNARRVYLKLVQIGGGVAAVVIATTLICGCHYSTSSLSAHRYFQLFSGMNWNACVFCFRRANDSVGHLPQTESE